jgi:hypothetical protein
LTFEFTGCVWVDLRTLVRVFYVFVVVSNPFLSL